MADIGTFNFYNLESYCKQMGLCYDGDWLRWIKDVINTKVGMFEYDNLPDGLTSQIIETALLFRNFLCFYKSDRLGLVLCYYIPNSEYNIYWKPKSVRLLAFNGSEIGNNIPYEDIILCRDNRMDIVPFLTLNSYISKIQEMEKTLEINVQLLRLPVVFTGSKTQIASFKGLIEKVAKFEPFAVGDKSIVDGIQGTSFELNINPLDIFKLMEQYRNMALSSIGIYAQEQKRERMLAAEIESANDYVDTIYQEMKNERLLWVAQLNKMGYNITMREAYKESQEDDIEIEAEKAGAVAEAEAKAEPKGGKEDGFMD